MIKLEKLGLSDSLKKLVESSEFPAAIIARINREHKERYTALCEEGEVEAEITGNLRFTAESREDFPAVGDWVLMSLFDKNHGIIHSILPRHSMLVRKAVGKQSEKQIIASNVDVAFIVQAIDYNFNINRLERYLSICYDAQIQPVLLISKTDLFTKELIEEVLTSLRSRKQNLEYYFFSNITGEGLNSIKECIEKGKIYCVLGSSGVGKSTLLNNLIGEEVLKTGEISESHHKGKHVTSHRELFLLDNGGIIIDTPGMRELGVADAESGIEDTFSSIVELAKECKYNNCTHTIEDGCAVLDGVEEGTVNEKSLENYQKMQREQQWFQSSQAEKRKKDRAFGKMVKSVMREKKREKER
jgi:ribosome biogenesis GTPase